MTTKKQNKKIPENVPTLPGSPNIISNLKNWRGLVIAIYGENSAPHRFIEEKIRRAPAGEEELMLQDANQFGLLLENLAAGDEKALKQLADMEQQEFLTADEANTDTDEKMENLLEKLEALYGTIEDIGMMSLTDGRRVILLGFKEVYVFRLYNPLNPPDQAGITVTMSAEVFAALRDLYTFKFPERIADDENKLRRYLPKELRDLYESFDKELENKILVEKPSTSVEVPEIDDLPIYETMSDSAIIVNLGTIDCLGCGREGVKRKRQSFCPGCYHLLSPSMRNALYEKIPEYYGNFRQALKQLHATDKPNKRVKILAGAAEIVDEQTAVEAICNLHTGGDDGK